MRADSRTPNNNTTVATSATPTAGALRMAPVGANVRDAASKVNGEVTQAQGKSMPTTSCTKAVR
jgi:hypothetical protein